MSRVLVVDDERSIRVTLSAFLGAKGHEVEQAEHFEQAMEFLDRAECKPDLVISDIILGGRDGVELLSAVKKMDPDIPVVLITGEPSLDTVTSSLRGGAFDYLAKPVLKEPLLRVTEKALEYQRLRKLSRELQQETARYRVHLEELVREQTEDIRAAHEALKASEARFRSLIATVPESVFELDSDGKVCWCNDQAKAIFGKIAEEDGLLASLADNESVDKWKLSLRAAFKEQEQINSVECAHRMADEKQRLFAWRFRAASPDRIEPARVLCTARDVTERRQLEERAKQKSKMEAIGQLAGGVAHDFNNILSAILAETSALQLEIGEGGANVSPSLRFLERAVVKAQDLTRKLLSFAHCAKSEFEAVDLNECIRGSAELVTRTLGGQIDLELNLPDESILVQGDSTELGQVFLNLAVNARDAILTGEGPTSKELLGTIRVKVRKVELASKLETQLAEIPPGDYVEISVSDNGSGISSEIQKRIFDPFFTTKARGQGTGMGLSLVYGIVSAHAGYLDLQSELGKGSTFLVYLPLLSGSSASLVSNAPRTTPVEGEVIVIDDEALVLDSTVRVLHKMGYRVHGFQKWQEGMSFFAYNKDSIAVVVLDFVMPGANSAEIIKQLRMIKSEVAVVVTSGYGLDRSLESDLRAGNSGFLQKPYRIDELSQVIQRLCGAAVVVQ